LKLNQIGQDIQDIKEFRIAKPDEGHEWHKNFATVFTQYTSTKALSKQSGVFNSGHHLVTLRLLLLSNYPDATLSESSQPVFLAGSLSSNGKLKIANEVFISSPYSWHNSLP
jgi:hypothetical protein